MYFECRHVLSQKITTMFSRLNHQDTDGDVLYVWTTLNLRAEHGLGNLYNQTYVLGMCHDDDKDDYDKYDVT